MSKYRVECCKHGYVEFMAESADQAEELAERMPDSAYSWDSAEDYRATEKIDE